MMGVFNNLVMFDQNVQQSSLSSIVPDLATGWSWCEEGTGLTLPLRQGVKWHDGRPFTAADVQCTWDLLSGKSADKLRVNPRKSWYENLEGHDERRLPGHLSPEAAAAGLCRVARFRFFPGLSLPCATARHAQPSDRHRPVQIRRVQAERAHQSGTKPGLLEERPALSRRHRVYHRPQPLDGDFGVRCRKVRHDFP